MSLKPSGFAMKYRLRPSGEYCGLMCLTPGNASSSSLTRLDVDDRKTLVPEDERLEIRVRALVRRVHELAAVGREVRMQVRVPVIRQLTYLARLDVHQEQVAEAVAHPGERERAAVGRPRRARDRAHTLRRKLAHDSPALDVHDLDPVVTLLERDIGELAAVRRPRTRRLDEAERVVVRTVLRARELADRPPRDCIGQVEIDREEITTPEVR